MAADVSGAAAD